jgi:ORF6N domain
LIKQHLIGENMSKRKTKSLIPTERIERSILLIRGKKVLLDLDLAVLYGVETRTLVQAVKRNRTRFPSDFMFQLSNRELGDWRSHFVMSNPGAKMGLRRPPYAFTEQGVAILSSVLRSEQAVAVIIEIMRAFVRLREILAGHAKLEQKLKEMESKYDGQFRVVFDAIRELMVAPKQLSKRAIGFHVTKDD